MYQEEQTPKSLLKQLSYLHLPKKRGGGDGVFPGVNSIAIGSQPRMLYFTSQPVALQTVEKTKQELRGRFGTPGG